MRTAPCPYFGECAGCSLQELDYSGQLARKTQSLAALLSAPESGIIVFSGPEFGYRNRMEFLFRKDGLGLRCRKAPGKTTKVEECKICSPQINALLAHLSQHFTDNNDAFRYAVIRATSISASISFVLNSASANLQQAIEKIRQYSPSSPAKNIIVTYTTPDEDEQFSGDFFVVKGEPFLTETLSKKQFRFSAQGFFQNNTAVAQKLHTYVSTILQKYHTNNSALLDLYAGVGTFGIINSSLFQKVMIVESFSGCTDSAEENLKLNGIKNAEVFRLEAHSIGRLSLPEGSYVITDPPRSGMSEKAISQLKRLRPKAIIYISCNPAQLAKDIRKFRDYSLQSTALFDMFPQTSHIEAVAELRLKP